MAVEYYSPLLDHYFVTANHRYLTSHSETGWMILQGWLVEGPVFCSLP